MREEWQNGKRMGSVYEKEGDMTGKTLKNGEMEEKKGNSK